MKKKGFNDKNFSIIEDLDLGIAKRETIFNRLKNPKIGNVIDNTKAEAPDGINTLNNTSIITKAIE